MQVRVAIVGSGPAGFYAADHLLRSDCQVAVDVFDRLATPWGLVRAGVAPDHPKIKSVTRVYEKTARLPGFRFLGNVDVGVDVSADELQSAYHAVIYTIGALEDRRLGIPGEHLAGCHGATSFVAWYNGHPDFADREFDLGVERVVVVGNGNVAVDVARMLALAPDDLAPTDIADHAIAALRHSTVKEIVVLGRRGPRQAAFTTPELRELGELADADIVVRAGDLLDPRNAAPSASDVLDATVRRNLELLEQYAARPPRGAPRRIELRFLASPVEIVGDGRVEAVRVVRNELVWSGGSARARATSARELVETGLVLRSIGYRGAPIRGVPFDDRSATIPNDSGRVVDTTGAPVPGLYAAGWIKRGPSGVIGTNKKCANETVERLLEDLRGGVLPIPTVDADELAIRLAGRGVQVVDYGGWEAIDAHERGLGAEHGRPRVKLVRRDEHLRHAASTA